MNSRASEESLSDEEEYGAKDERDEDEVELLRTDSSSYEEDERQPEGMPEERGLEQERHERHQHDLGTQEEGDDPEELAEVDRGTRGRRHQERAERFGLALALEGTAQRQSRSEEHTSELQSH